jgi:hypothetical protein
LKYIGKAVAATTAATLALMAFAGQASADASKTDNHVDLGVYGKKLHVDSAAIWANSPSLEYCLTGSLTFTPPKGSGFHPATFHTYHPRGVPCGNGDGSQDLAQNTEWPNNTEVCATFHKNTDGKRWGGKPCVTIHN